MTGKQNKKAVYILVGILMILSSFVYGQQDAVFSQYYANPLYLNPALTGNGDCSRATLNYRNQYPKIPHTYLNYQFSLDTYSPVLQGGLGLLFQSDRIGDNAIVTTNISAFYAYNMMLSRNTMLNAGFQLSFRQYSFNGDKLIFQDMIDPGNGHIIGSSADFAAQHFSSYNLDYSTGIFLNFSKKYYLGISTHHLTEPSTPYYIGDNINHLKRKYSLHGGSIFPISLNYYQKMQLSPNFIVQYQDSLWRINGGVNLNYEMFTLGLWYHNARKISESLIFIVGIKINKFKLGYSYDYLLSGLSGLSGGSHEVSLSFNFKCKQKNYKKNAINCPEF